MSATFGLLAWEENVMRKLALLTVLVSATWVIACQSEEPKGLEKPAEEIAAVAPQEAPGVEKASGLAPGGKPGPQATSPLQGTLAQGSPLVPPSATIDSLKCMDKIKNGTETDIDCGGSCLPVWKCANGKGCSVGGDCASGVCKSGTCQNPTCTDGVKNGTEVDVDCRGSCPAGCAINQACGTNTDCQSAHCKNGVCSTCVAEVSAGGNHTCARKVDGTLWCWGRNSFGQLGDGSTLSETLPVQVTTLGSNVVEVSAGNNHTCARKADGTLWCWGWNDLGQVGPSPWSPSPVQVTALGSSVVEVSAGDSHTCARKADGTLWCWGMLPLLGVGKTDYGTSPPVEVKVQLGTNVAEIEAGMKHTCARKNDGSLWCWGANDDGELGDGTTNFCQYPGQVSALGANCAGVTVGWNHTCARKTGTLSLWCWGNNLAAELGDGTKVKRSSPVGVVGLSSNVVEVSAGGQHTCARKSDGTLWCWGLNNSGQLGVGTNTQVASNSPVQLTALGSSVVEVSAGGSHTCARKADGTLWCWGENGTGQLGDGTEVDKHSPVQVPLTCP